MISEYDQKRTLHFSVFPRRFNVARLIALEWAGVLWEQVKSIKACSRCFFLLFLFEQALASQLHCVCRARADRITVLIFLLSLVVLVYFRNCDPYTHSPMASSVIRFHCFSPRWELSTPFCWECTTSVFLQLVPWQAERLFNVIALSHKRE